MGTALKRRKKRRNCPSFSYKMPKGTGFMPFTLNTAF